MDGSLTDQQVLRALIEEYHPAVHEKLTSLDAPIAVITLPWFLCLFIQCVSWETSVRILDLFFSFGRKILFQLALAVFNLNRETILNCTDSIELILALKEFLPQVKPDTLIQTSFEYECLKESHIDELWSQYHPQILLDIENAKQKEKLPAETPPQSPVSSPRVSPKSAKNSPILLRKNPPTAPKKPKGNARFRFSRRKSFQLRQTTEQLRDMVANTRCNAGVVSILHEGFTEDIDENSEEEFALAAAIPSPQPTRFKFEFRDK